MTQSTPVTALPPAAPPVSVAPPVSLSTPAAGTAKLFWFLSWARRVGEFGVLQCWVQLVSSLAGLLIVRTLAKDQYAFLAIAVSMQAAAKALADLGIGIGVRSIGGKVYQDRHRFGQLLHTALQLRHKFAIVSIGSCLPIAAWMLRDNGADWLTVVLLCATIVAGILPELTYTVVSVAPLLHGEYRRLQKLDFANAALRLGMIAALAASRMNAVLAASATVITNWTLMIVTRRWAREHVDLSAPQNADDRRELSKLSLRCLPNTLFYSFQGQVTLLILTLVGNTTGIADVSALGRLSVLITVFSVAFTNVLAPRFARCQDAHRLPRLYLLLIGSTILQLAPVMALAWLFPAPLLWVLGGSYAALGKECGWVVTTGCIAQLCAVLWILNISKAWIRVSTILWIPLTLGLQTLFAGMYDLTVFKNVLMFQLMTVAVPLPLYAIDAVYGLRQAARSGAHASSNSTPANFPC